MRLAVVLLAACSANEEIPAPAITTIVPAAGRPGSTVTLTGTAFCQATPRTDDAGTESSCKVSGTVHFGDDVGTWMSWEDDAIVADVPLREPGDADVRIQVRGRWSNAIAFTIE